MTANAWVASLTFPLYRPLQVRDPREGRSQTSLELLFDLAFSAASGFAALRVAETLRTGAWGEAVLGFAMVFFAIWWAWLNFSWFTSAYDTNDGLTWMVTTLQILGACVLAAGVPRAVAEQDFTVITVGYAVMRLPLVAQWCRAAASDPARRATCLRYAAGLVALQVGWLGRLSLPVSWSLPTFLLLAGVEVAVPSWAQRRGRMPVNPEHLAGRYGRFTLTVAAQVVAAAIYGFQAGVASGPVHMGLVMVAAVSLLLVVCLLWLYFALPHGQVAASHLAKLWEYGHYLLVGAICAVGAGARFLAEATAPGGPGEPGDPGGWAAHPLVAAVATAVAAFWVVCVVPARQHGRVQAHARYLMCVALTLLAPVLAPGPLWTSGVVALLLLALAATGGLARAG